MTYTRLHTSQFRDSSTCVEGFTRAQIRFEDRRWKRRAARPSDQVISDSWEHDNNQGDMDKVKKNECRATPSETNVLAAR